MRSKDRALHWSALRGKNIIPLHNMHAKLAHCYLVYAVLHVNEHRTISGNLSPSVTYTRYFSYINILQGSVATCLRWGGIFNDHFVTEFMESVIVKEFKNQPVFLYLMKLCLKYNTGGFFADTVYLY